MPYTFIKVPVEDLRYKLPPATENWDDEPAVVDKYPVIDLTSRLPPPEENWDEDEPVTVVINRLRIEPVPEEEIKPTCNKEFTEYSTVWEFEENGALKETKTKAYTVAPNTTVQQSEATEPAPRLNQQPLFSKGKYRNRDWKERAKIKKWWN